MCEPKSADFSGPLQPGNAPLVLIYLDKLISHATGINDESCFGAILDHLAGKKDHGDFLANEKLETGEFNDIVSARLYELETQVKQLIIVKTFETQFAKQNARIQQCEKIMKELNLASWRDTLEKQAATMKEMKK